MIVTFFNTFFCINHDTLFHVNMCDYNDHKEQIASLEDMMRCGYKMIPLNDYGVFCCAQDGAFLSPQPDGTVAHAARPLGWEQFRFCDGGEPLQVAPVDEGTTIPKIIHQTEDPSTIREQFIPNINQLKSLNKEYKYIYYSEKDRHDFIYQHYGWDILKVYLRINPRYGAARADLFRYLCLYRYGASI